MVLIVYFQLLPLLAVVQLEITILLHYQEALVVVVALVLELLQQEQELLVKDLLVAQAQTLLHLEVVVVEELVL
jgi:hypothetical protein